MASLVWNIWTKNYQNLVIGFQVVSQKCWECFFETLCILQLKMGDIVFSLL